MATETGVDKKFVDAYRDFCKKYNELVSDKFNGVMLDGLTNEFRQKHSDDIQKLIDRAGIEPISSGSDAHAEDFKILSKDCGQIKYYSEDNYQEYIDHVVSSNDSKILLSDLYWRACEASHLRATFNMSRKKQDDDRFEAVLFGRLALRYDKKSAFAIFWYAMSLAWYSATMPKNLKSATVAHNLKLACERCLKIDPYNTFSNYVLARYYYDITKLTWIQKQAASTLLGIKLTGTLDDAKRHLLVSLKSNPTFGPSGLIMARILLDEKGAMDEIKRWIDHGLNYVPLEPSSEIERENLLELQSKLKIPK